MLRPMIDYLAQLSARERFILLGGGLSGIVMLMWVLGVQPLYDRVDSLNKLTERKQGAAVELAEVLTAYQALAAKGSVKDRTRTSANFSLLSFLEGLAARSNVKGNIKYMRPTTADVSDGIREHSVEIKLANVRLNQMVSLLTAVEQAPHGLRVKRLHVKRRFSDATQLDVTFTVSRYSDS